jgi:rod shape-determining protein MreC
MAVVTPDGIVGKVIQAFPVAAQVLLVTDSTFAAGVMSQKNHVRGTLKGQGGPTCLVDYVQNEEKVDKDEWFYTSGDDRVFPKGLPVGQAAVVRQGKNNKEIYVTPSGLQTGFEEVLIVLEGVHQPIPDPSQANPNLHMLAPPPVDTAAAPAAAPDQPAGTDADRLVERYRKIGDVQGHKYGEGGVGSKPPNFNIDVDKVHAPGPSAAPVAVAGTPAATESKQPPPGASAKPPTPAVPAPASSPRAARPPEQR